MKSKSVKINARIESALKYKLLQHYNCKKLTEALNKAIDDVILKIIWSNGAPKKNLTSSDFAKSKKDCDISIYVNGDYFDILSNHYNTQNKSAVIRSTINDALSLSLNFTPTIGRKDYLYYMLGKKPPEMNDAYTPIFSAIKGLYSTYIEPFTGTANVLLHKTSCGHEVINDIGKRQVNLLKVLRDNVVELKVELLKIINSLKNEVPTDLESIFNNCKNKTSYINEIDDAVCFLLTRMLSYMHDGKTFYDKQTSKVIKKFILNAHAFNCRLANVKLSNNDARYFIDSYNEKDVLAYIDSPYPYTEYVYRNNTSDNKVFKAHKSLSNKLCNFSGYFIYSCRVTSSPTLKKKEITDERMVMKIDSLYKNKGFFYIDIALPRPKGQIERIITNFNFKGATEYN